MGKPSRRRLLAWDANVLQLTLDVQPDSKSFAIDKRAGKVQEVLQKILTDSPSYKALSAWRHQSIWLFCFIQHCSHLEEVQSKLRECQAAFSETAQRKGRARTGDSITWPGSRIRKGDPALREELVRDLVSSFTGTGPQLKVDQETELSAGALPTGEGKSITSCKDIVNLANEVGDREPGLQVHVAGDECCHLVDPICVWALWTRAISSLTPEVDPKLYPKLYRYRFDPNQNVQKSMNDILEGFGEGSQRGAGGSL